MPVPATPSFAGQLEELQAQEQQAGITPDPEVGLSGVWLVCGA